MRELRSLGSTRLQAFEPAARRIVYASAHGDAAADETPPEQIGQDLEIFAKRVKCDDDDAERATRSACAPVYCDAYALEHDRGAVPLAANFSRLEERVQDRRRRVQSQWAFICRTIPCPCVEIQMGCIVSH